MYSVKFIHKRVLCAQLWEHISTPNKHLHTPVKHVFHWRAQIIHIFFTKLATQYPNQITPNGSNSNNNGNSTSIDPWNAEFHLNNELAMRLLVAMKLISTMHQRPRIQQALDHISEISDEEAAFWAWKILSQKTKGLNAIKAMYL